LGRGCATDETGDDERTGGKNTEGTANGDGSHPATVTEWPSHAQELSTGHRRVDRGLLPRLCLRLGVIALPSRELCTDAAPCRADAAPGRSDPSSCRADPAADARSEDARAVQHPSLELLGTRHRLELCRQHRRGGTERAARVAEHTPSQQMIARAADDRTDSERQRLADERGTAARRELTDERRLESIDERAHRRS